MFRGTYYHSADAKGRVAIPRKFRDTLVSAQGDTSIVVTTNPTLPCLDVYPTSEWSALEDRVRAKDQFDPQTQAFKQLYIAPAKDMDLDAQGRLLVPPELREQIGMEKEVAFTGDLEKFLLWSKPVLDAHRRTVREASRQPGYFKHLGL